MHAVPGSEEDQEERQEEMTETEKKVLAVIRVARKKLVPGTLGMRLPQEALQEIDRVLAAGEMEITGEEPQSPTVRRRLPMAQ